MSTPANAAAGAHTGTATGTGTATQTAANTATSQAARATTRTATRTAAGPAESAAPGSATGSGTRPPPLRAPRRFRARILPLLFPLALLLAGCGIRSTAVPTDVGAAPSRAACAMSAPGIEAQSARGIAVQVFLVCSSQLVTAERKVRIPSGTTPADRVRVADALLDQLERTPLSTEFQAGYTTDVRRGMTVTGPRGGDPDETLRLSTPPQDLTSYALAQVVCTFANSPAAADSKESVVLGGPDQEPLRRYSCPPELRARPGTTEPPSAQVGN